MRPGRRPYQGTDEEAVVERAFACNRVVDVELLALGEARGEMVVGQAAELELEGECGLDVTNGLFLAPHTTHLAESVVDRVLARATVEDGDTRNTSAREHIAVTVDEVEDLLVPGIVVHIIGLVEDTQHRVQHVRRLVIGTPESQIQEASPQPC